ncbi:S9 family peptidase [Geothrix sp. PMB-07]|uniref:alpha/beta hydrolase family protein n=1 Tax=Geothrix sp. PMB-07 TaxID=3068640 RepID=UPI0027415F76|nr:alpha/beta fold hydrolase [Geothrix sp. PMB-07]WLT31351.1 alpha/beta fold hydrolase [Geothrix sp. PMB-07]
MRTLRLLAPLASLVLIPAWAAAPASTEMAITSADGFALKGTLTLPTAKGKVPVVILAHQFGSNRSGWAPLADRLAARGIGTLALDLRGHGTSTQKNGAPLAVTPNLPASAKAVGLDQIPADLAKAATWLRKQPGVDGRRIGLAGASLGAFSALLATHDVHALAVLGLSPAGNVAFGDAAKEHLKHAVLKGRASTLILTSYGDKESTENATSLKDLPGVTLSAVDGEAHGFDFLKDRADLMAVFFGEYLTYHHTGKTYAAAAAKPASTPKNVINEQTLAERAKGEAPK